MGRLSMSNPSLSRVAVAGDRDEEDAGISASLNRRLQRGRVRLDWTFPRVVGGDDLQAVPALEVGEIVERGDRSGDSAPNWTEELGRDVLYFGRDTGDSVVVVLYGGDLAGDAGAVGVDEVKRHLAGEDPVVVVEEVPAEAVVDVTVVVVVDAVDRVPKVDELVLH